MSASPLRPVPRAGVLDIEPYVPGKSKATGGSKVYKLSSNETPFGPSPRAIEAYRAAADRLEVYPDGNATALRGAVAAAHGLDAARILCGAGSDELLYLLAYAYLAPGDEGIYTEHGFSVYPIAIHAAGGTPVVVPERNLTADVDAILGAVTPRTRLVYLANPNNPTGTYLPFDEVRRLHAGLPGNVILVLDAAYAEYVRRNDYEAGVELAGAAENVVMTRTLSKIYGLAGARIGWMYAPAAIIDAVNRIRGPFNMSTPAVAAGVAALADRAFVQAAADHNAKWLPRVTERIEALGLRVTPSAANFVLVHFADPATANAADAHLSSQGVIVRQVGGYGLPHCLRVTIGSAEANEAMLAALAGFLGAGR